MPGADTCASTRKKDSPVEVTLSGYLPILRVLEDVQVHSNSNGGGGDDWSGRTIAGRSWTKADSRDKPLTGTLRVAQASPDVFHVRFTVISLDPAHFFEGHGSSVIASER